VQRRFDSLGLERAGPRPIRKAFTAEARPTRWRAGAEDAEKTAVKTWF